MSGLFGVVAEGNCAELLVYGTDYHSHLGTQYGGIAVKGTFIDRRVKDIHLTQFKSRFMEESSQLKGPIGIGAISVDDPQPVFLNSRHGSFALCINGRINNIPELVAELYDRGISFSESYNGRWNVVEVIGKLITLEKDLLTGIQRMFDRIIGSCSILVLHEDGIYAARDRFGNSPLIIAQRGRDFVVTSETTAIPNLGFRVLKDMQPGEIILMTEGGLITKQKGVAENNSICSFLWVYTGFPASSYEGINAEIVRERCGAHLARRHPVDADLVSGVPDSGTTHAIGFANESKLPFRRSLVKYTPGYGRSYTPPTQAVRDKIATMKLIPVKDIINGNRIVICDDSIVRGTQLKNFTIAKLMSNGAREVHVRIACPPLMFPCKFNVSTESLGELVARRAIRSLEGRDVQDVSDYCDATSDKYQAMVEWIRKDLGVNSLAYQTLDDMIDAIGLPKEKLCTYCWAGQSKCFECSGACGRKKAKEKETATA